jgi:hypothetical protein
MSKTTSIYSSLAADTNTITICPKCRQKIADNTLCQVDWQGNATQHIECPVRIPLKTTLTCLDCRMPASYSHRLEGGCQQSSVTQRILSAMKAGRI